MANPKGARHRDASGLVIAVCAVAMTALVGYREFRAQSGSEVRRNPPPVKIDGWETLLHDRPRLGSPQAPVVMVEFADLECPACRAYAATLDSIQKLYPEDLMVLFAHFPLSYHRFARASAVAAECAYEQGRFTELRRVLYKKQDSLGLKSWVSYAEEAGIPRIDEFSACLDAPESVRRVDRDLELGAKFEVNSTPTVIINGWRWTAPPTFATLDSIMKTSRQRASMPQDSR